MHEQILEFWFDEVETAQWWRGNAAFDRLIADRFGAMHAAATRCELYAWRTTPAGRLAEIIVLDQFSRNIHRGTPSAFANDALALALAQEAVHAGADRPLPQVRRNFVYMPYMHSESPEIHVTGTILFRDNGDESTVEFARRHREIIERFGRYPHRNAILGRTSTAAEIEFLGQAGSSF